MELAAGEKRLATLDLEQARGAIRAVLNDSGARLEKRLAALGRDAAASKVGVCLLAGGAEELGSGQTLPEAWDDAPAEAGSDRLLCGIGREGESYGVLGVSGRIFTPGDAARLQALADFIGELLHTRLAFRQGQSRWLQSEEELKRQRQIIDHIHDSVIAMDLGGYITSWNKGAENLFGYTAEEAIGRNILFIYADENEEDGLLSGLFLGQGSGREMVVRRRKKSGEVFWASLSLSLVLGADGHPSGVIGYLVDITERLRSEEQLRLQAAIFEHSDEGIVVADVENHIVSVNRAFSKITGYPQEETLGRTPGFLLSDLHDEKFYADMQHSIADSGHWIGELWLRRKSGELFPAWMSTSTVHNRDGKATHFFSMFSDITERKNAEKQIYRLAYYDTLTGLPNRAMLQTLLKQAITEARRNRYHGAVLFVDLDRFKQVNDTLGHALGDKLLIQVAQLIRSALRAEDVVARIGSDEFVVALFDITRREHASVVAQKILLALSEPIILDGGHEILVSASIGISVYPEDGDDPETLIQNADIAMARVKLGEGQDGHLFFSPQMNLRALERLRLEWSLRRALEREELLLHYQPQLDLATGEMVGAEVLLRWQHPEMGMVSPGQFIPLAEETGLIVAIGEWTLETVCRKNKAWQEAGLPIVKLAVNISARQFRPLLAKRVEAMLQDTGLAPEFLELEITESVVMHNTEGMIELMAEFKRQGVSLSLDDFGTGYSSLNYLKRFPLDKLKIDQSFVRGLPGDASDSAIARTIINLARNLDLRVIAEGVETEEQLAFLREAACEEIQGYHYSRPLPEEKFVEFLRARRAGA